MKLKLMMAGIFAVMAATPSVAADIGKARSRPVDRTYQSGKGIFELERCLIEVDAQGIPSVYRQPDRPETTLIGYSAGTGVPILIELTAVTSGTRMDIRAGRFLTKAPIAEGFERCV